MKFCPNCKTNYTDDTLRFCLSDGASLIAMPGAEKTVEMTGLTNQMRFDAAPRSEQTLISPVNQPSRFSAAGNFIFRRRRACRLYSAETLGSNHFQHRDTDADGNRDS
jgi:hypothetical protein